MKEECQIFSTPAELAHAVADDFLAASQKAEMKQKKLSIALSGGSTPEILFNILANSPYKDGVRWEEILLFWGDERCVPPDNPESNYGLTRRTLLDDIHIPKKNIFRIRGEDQPEIEAHRYATILRKHLPLDKFGHPRFDWIFLGLGNDGHTASIFPGSAIMKLKNKICVVAEHPQSRQKRITLTLPMINRANKITFLVTGSLKSQILREIFDRNSGFEKYPAALVQPVDGTLLWYLNREAGAALSV